MSNHQLNQYLESSTHRTAIQNLADLPITKLTELPYKNVKDNIDFFNAQMHKKDLLINSLPLKKLNNKQKKKVQEYQELANKKITQLKTSLEEKLKTIETEIEKENLSFQDIEILNKQLFTISYISNETNTSSNSFYQMQKSIAEKINLKFREKHNSIFQGYLFDANSIKPNYHKTEGLSSLITQTQDLKKSNALFKKIAYWQLPISIAILEISLKPISTAINYLLE
jgi:hypothetical protein